MDDQGLGAVAVTHMVMSVWLVVRAEDALFDKVFAVGADGWPDVLLA